MKRDWEIIRKLLIDIEEGNDFIGEIPDCPKYDGGSRDEYAVKYKEIEDIQHKIAGHIELLVDGFYIENISVVRSLNGSVFFNVRHPRLTMAGHDLLDTMRSHGMWENIKSTAKEKGIELTFDAVKAIGGAVLASVIGG